MLKNAAAVLLLALCTQSCTDLKKKTTMSALPAPIRLRSEFLDQPVGIDVVKPRLSWQIESQGRNVRQSAYQVVVASDAAQLNDHKGDIWDSGKVVSDESVNVAYDGPALESRKRYYWQVRWWNQAGQPSAFSDASYWEMGLLSSPDWKAQWINRDDPEDEADRTAGVRWVWAPGEPKDKTVKVPHYFRFVFDAAADLKSASLFATAKDAMTISVNGKEISSVYPVKGWGTFKEYALKPMLVSGKNVIAITATTTGGPAGLAALLKLTSADGTIRRFVSDPSWKVSAKKVDGWDQIAFNDVSWKPSVVVAELDDTKFALPWPPKPANLLRRGFAVNKDVKRARVYATALGSYRLHINGQRVGKDILTPDWTDYRKRVLYQAYDVTSLLKKGENAIGAMLGDGWYASGLGWQLQRYLFGPPPPRLLAQLEIEFTDGSRETVASDASWKATPGPILRSELYAGEIYDARLEQKGWDQASFDDSKWNKTKAFDAPKAELAAQNSPKIQVTGTVKPVAVTHPSPDTHIFDMGQNMVGWVRLNVKGAAGTSVRMRFAEILQSNGQIYRDNLRAAEATDAYVLRGGAAEEFEPHFTYHGFRYVEVTGFPGTPDLNSISGVVFQTATPFSGKFTSSNQMVNKIWQNVFWGQRGNFVSVPTDCPQRDERLGWLGDAQIFWRTAAYNMDIASFTHKFMQDIVDAQSKEGAFPDVAPRVIDLADGAPAWGDAGIILPWTAYRQYADKEIIRQHWNAMEAWMKYIHAANPDLVRRKRRNNDFGDWVPANSETPKDLLATAYWAYDAQLMSEMAGVIDRPDDAERYQKLFERIRRAFQREFIKSDGTVGNGSQTSYALALHMNLLPERLRKLATDKLVADIQSRNGHLSTGFAGAPYLMLALTENGRQDVAYRLLLNDTYPSWGYMVKKGATTIWERWNGDSGDPAMNSFNHYAFGSVAEWLYRYVAGIDTDAAAPGFKKTIIRPVLDSRITHAQAEYDSHYGKIVSAWTAKPRQAVSLDVTIPANTSATIYIPAKQAEDVTENGKAIGGDSGVIAKGQSGNYAVFEVGSGVYHFQAKQ